MSSAERDLLKWQTGKNPLQFSLFFNVGLYKLRPYNSSAHGVKGLKVPPNLFVKTLIDSLQKLKALDIYSM